MTVHRIALFIFATLAGVTLARADSLADYSLSLHEKFPDVQFIQPEILEVWLADPDRKPPLILDVRDPGEFAVSHLANAKLAESDPVAQLQKLGAQPEMPVVVYCSVGYRSALLARRLRTAGFKRVYNLEGSIFAWAGKGRPLVNEHGPAIGAHPYDKNWGRYLDRTLWRWEPETQSP